MERSNWQHHVAEVQRAQIDQCDRERKTERVKDLAYGQNLIKQLGYRRTKDKAPRNEPAGTLYDTFFESRVHASKELSKRIDNTRSH